MKKKKKSNVKKDKGKDKFVPAHAIRHKQGVQLQPCSFLTSALGAVEWSTSRSDRFTPG
jgi:hypothetical protein